MRSSRRVLAIVVVLATLAARVAPAVAQSMAASETAESAETAETAEGAASESERAASELDDGTCSALSDDEVRVRLGELRDAVHAHEHDMRRWATAWLAIHLVMTGVQLTLALTADNDGARIDGWTGTLSSALGIATLAYAWPPLLGAGAFLDELRLDSPTARREALVLAEARVRRSSDAVGFVRGPVTPILNAAFVGAVGATLLLGWGRVTAGYLLSAGGSVVAQSRVLLHPSGIREAWLRYVRRHPDARDACELGTRAGGTVSFELMPTPMGTVPGSLGIGAAIVGRF